MKQRIKMYEYSIDSLNLTIPSMIDSMDNYFVGQPYAGKPDAIYLIGVDTTFTYTYYYYHTWDWQQIFNQVDNAIPKALDDLVDDTEAPVVEVTSPKQGDEITPGGTYTIQWTATDNYSVASREIYLSTDNGTTWEMIDSTDGNTGGSYSWDVPAQNYGDCKIKVCASDRFYNKGEDESGTFSIGPTEITCNLEEAENRIMFKRTKGSFMVFLPFTEGNTVTVSDVRGKRIASFATSGDKLWYPVPVSLSSGMHIITIRTPDKTIVEKFWFVR